MVCEILSVGTELLLGDITDTNSAFLSRHLRELGIFVYHHSTVGDNSSRLEEQMRLSLSRADLVLVTGGLGPTYDDITRDVASKVFDIPLKLDGKVTEDIKAFFDRRGMKMSENNLRQAQVPQGAKVLSNLWGTAPGLWLEKEGKQMILMPGVPEEMKRIFLHYIKPELSKLGNKSFSQKILHFYGISESELDERIKPLFNKIPSLSIAPYAGKGEVELHLTAFAETLEKAEEVCNEAKEEILSMLSEYFYAEGESSLEEALVSKFSRKGLSLSVAESCTGGMVSERITSVSGASNVMGLSVTTYLEKMKQNVLGVSEETLEKHGVYSKECALAMARGVRALSESDLGIGITGIAGPSGGTDQDPVGTVYIALSSNGKEEVKRFVFGHKNSSRDAIRYRAASQALFMALFHFD